MLIHCFNVISTSAIQKRGCFKSGGYFPLGKFYKGQLSRRKLFQGNCPDGKYPGGIAQGANVWGQLSGRELYRGNCLGAKV